MANQQFGSPPFGGDPWRSAAPQRSCMMTIVIALLRVILYLLMALVLALGILVLLGGQLPLPPSPAPATRQPVAIVNSPTIDNYPIPEVPTLTPPVFEPTRRSLPEAEPTLQLPPVLPPAQPEVPSEPAPSQLPTETPGPTETPLPIIIPRFGAKVDVHAGQTFFFQGQVGPGDRLQLLYAGRQLGEDVFADDKGKYLIQLGPITDRPGVFAVQLWDATSSKTLLSFYIHTVP